MRLTLWGRGSSVNVQKVLWALDEVGADFEQRVVGHTHGGLDDPAFTALTPQRLIPVLETPEGPIWESHAILRWIGRRWPEHDLGRGLTRADPWMDFGTGVFQPPFIRLFFQRVRLPVERRSADAEAAAVKAVIVALDVIGRGLVGPYLTGERITLADIALGTPMFRLFDIAPDLRREKIDRWIDQIATHSGWKDRVAVSYDELRP